MRRIRMWGLLAVFLLAASAPAAADVVSIDETNFPDVTFRDHVKDEWDKDNNGTLSDEEIAAVDSAYVHSKGIRSLKGIELFTKLEELRCSGNQLTSLDVSKNKKLKELKCWSNQLTSLDVSENTELVSLDCFNNLLTSLGMSKNKKLVKLDCRANQLTSLDVSKNKKLERLDCYRNKLTALDVSQNTALVKLDCSYNQLTSLDVSKNKKLERLDCYRNRLTALDVSKNTKLKELDCRINRLTFLDLGGLGELVSTDVDVGGQTRDGLKVRKIGSEYVVDLGEFLLSADRFDNVNDLAGKAGSTDLAARYDSASGRASFDALPDTVTYRYDTGKDALSMDVRLTTEPVSPDVPVSYRITVIPSDHGRITLQGSTDALSGDVIVSADSTVTFVVSADAGYEIESWKVDGAPVSVPAGTVRYEYPIRNVTKDYRLEARFKAKSTPPAPPSDPDVPPTPPSGPGVPSTPPGGPGVPPVTPPVTLPVSPDVPAPSAPEPADIPSSANQWTIRWGTRDAQGNVSVTVQVPIKSEAPLNAGSIRLESSGIGKVSIVLLPGDPTGSARAAAQKRAYTLQVTGTVAESARDTARIDAVRYKLEGSNEEMRAPLGRDGNGILLKDMTDMTQKPGTPEPDSGGGGCDAGVSGLMLALVGAFLLRRKV